MSLRIWPVKPIVIPIAAVIGGFAMGGASLPSVPPVASAPPTRIAACRAVDGDTLRCGDERIRLIGIDSPEMPGHCRPGRHCVAGDPFAAKAALAAALGSDMGIERFGADHYGRTLALVSGPGGDLSCRQLRAGQAIYRRDWDVDGRMMRGCG